MKKQTIIVLVLICCSFALFDFSEAKRKNYYRTYEIIDIAENSLTLQDNDGNVIEVDKDPGEYKVGYKVRYDSVRKRLRPYRWQDYEVTGVSGNSITLKHKTGETLSLAGNYSREYEVGDAVRYDSVGNKLQLREDSGQWQQYTVVAAERDYIILESTTGKQLTLYLDNNIYEAPRGLFIARYKVGDHVRYNAATNAIREGIRRTYDWQDYTVKEVTARQIILVDENKEELILENTYATKFRAGDAVKYDRLNNLLKKVR